MGKYITSRMSDEDFAKEIETYKSINFPLDWKRVKCYSGYYEFNPKKKIAYEDVPTLKIYSSECTPSFNEIIKKHRLPQIKWHIDTDFNIVLSDEELFINAIPNIIKKLEKQNNEIGADIIINIKNKEYSIREWNDLIEPKISEQKQNHNNTSIFEEEYVLNWEHLKCTKGYYIFVPFLEDCFVKTLTIKHPQCTKDFNRIIDKHKDKLPKIYFKISENYEVKLSSNSINQIKSAIANIILQEEKDRKEKKELKLLEKKYEKLFQKGIDISIFQKTFTINWENVIFYKNYYTFNPNYNNTISKNHIEKLHINDIRSRESFNFIIKYLMKRMPIIHYKITENFTIKLLDTPLLEVAINFLVKEQTKYDIGVGEIADVTGRTLNAERLTFDNAMSKAASMKPEDFKKYKSQFINYLILQQHKQYKVVPMSESITHSNVKYEEATFIFTTKGWDNNLLLIIENVNPDRSTVIFRINPNHYTDALQTIFDFMQSDIVNKRSGIREKNLEFSNCGIIEYWSCNHDSFDDWKERMKRHIGNQ